MPLLPSKNVMMATIFLCNPFSFWDRLLIDKQIVSEEFKMKKKLRKIRATPKGYSSEWWAVCLSPVHLISRIQSAAWRLVNFLAVSLASSSYLIKHSVHRIINLYWPEGLAENRWTGKLLYCRCLPASVYNWHSSGIVYWG